ncbi:hypothetical protein KY285_015453 [Solanum tuberosum]|nr:hypothetical protein KY285_015453 [Solanum tuberosum]
MQALSLPDSTYRKDFNQTPAQTRTAYMDANIQAASKDLKDFKQTPAQSRTASLDANVHAASMDTKDLKQTPTQFRTAYMDANVQAASKDPKDLKQTPAQSRTASLDANVHAASMDTKDLKQTPTQFRYTFIHFPLTRNACTIAVELFLTEDGQILLNEVALRPHNSGHHTIEACFTSQYEQHLRTVVGLPLGDPSMKTPAAVMTPAIDTNQLSGMDPTEHTKNPGHSRYNERKASNSTQAHTNKQSTDRKKRKTSSQGVIGNNDEISTEVLNDLNPGDERTEIRNTSPPDFFKSIETEEITSLRERVTSTRKMMPLYLKTYQIPSLISFYQYKQTKWSFDTLYTLKRYTEEQPLPCFI